MLAKIRRMHLREHRSIREIARQPRLVEPVYPKREVITKLDAYADTLSSWMKANQHRGKRERRTVHSMYQELTAMGYRGGYGRVAAFARRFQAELVLHGSGRAFVPLKFQLGEAFQFDWSTEYAFVGGLRRRLDLAHTKLCASRAFWLTAYPTQSHEMLFDAHARAFAAFGGIPTRGIDDNMKPAVDKVGRGKARTINARFEAMTSHYLFEPEFCNVASGWEKGIVEKNVQDRRRQIWREAMGFTKRFSWLATYNVPWRVLAPSSLSALRFLFVSCITFTRARWVPFPCLDSGLCSAYISSGHESYGRSFSPTYLRISRVFHYSEP
jgi:transposase